MHCRVYSEGQGTESRIIFGLLKGRVTVLYYKWPTFTVKNRL